MKAPAVAALAAGFGDASSGSDIRFHGNPTSFQKEESGDGDVYLSGG